MLRGAQISIFLRPIKFHISPELCNISLCYLLFELKSFQRLLPTQNFRPIFLNTIAWKIISWKVLLIHVNLYDFFLTDKETAIKLFRQVEDACILLSEYNFRLNAELEERKQVGKILYDFLTCQKEQVVKGEEKLQVCGP